MHFGAIFQGRCNPPPLFCKISAEYGTELESDGNKINERIQRIALGRLGTPEDIAHACAFLASDRANYISGQILGVDGCASI